MLDSTGFDLWAKGYDADVEMSDEGNEYPFAGYKKVLAGIYNTVMGTPNAVVLDLGFGTGTLTTKLYEGGCIIYGQDFSLEMIAAASEKMPDAHLYQGDFARGLCEPLKEQLYDFIIATYSIHHLPDSQKIQLLKELCKYLRGEGKILIGDVAFENCEELERCKAEYGESWDDEEIYCVADELRKEFRDLHFEKVTFCSGILTLGKTDRDLLEENI